MAARFTALLLAIEKRLSALDGGHEHRTGLGLARSHAPAFAGLLAVPRATGAAIGRWVDSLAVQVVAVTDALLPGLSGALRPRARTKPGIGERRN